MKRLCMCTLVIGTVCSVFALAVPAAAQAFVYRVINGYNKGTVGHVNQEPAPTGTPQAQVLNIVVDSPALGLARTEVYAGEGQWLRHTLDSHGVPTEYEFASALPAIKPPFNAGQSWSARVNAVVKLGGESVQRSVRVDGTVLGTERLNVPAGEFDTVKIRRFIYPGDRELSKSETHIYEVDWYAPALGRSVRTETRSSWMEPCGRRLCEHRGDWFIYELTQAAKK